MPDVSSATLLSLLTLGRVVVLAPVEALLVLPVLAPWLAPVLVLVSVPVFVFALAFVLLVPVLSLAPVPVMVLLRVMVLALAPRLRPVFVLELSRGLTPGSVRVAGSLALATTICVPVSPPEARRVE